MTNVSYLLSLVAEVTKAMLRENDWLACSAVTAYRHFTSMCLFLLLISFTGIVSSASKCVLECLRNENILLTWKLFHTVDISSQSRISFASVVKIM
jgi:hypothetical protein